MRKGHHIRIRQQLGRFTLDVDLQSKAGGVTAICGPSGSGKTSLINAIAGLSTPQEAFIQIGDRVLSDTAKATFVKPHDRRVGYVFQDARLFPHLTVEKNLRYGAKANASLTDVTTLLGINHLLDRHPNALSGGEAQRVAIGRALLSQPDVFLMDEPLASLDQARRDEVLPYLDQLHRFSGTQIFYVTHSMAEVARLADQIVLLKEGQVSRAGPAMDILSDPAALPDIGVREAGAVLRATLTNPDAGDGLSALTTSNGTLFLPRINAPEGASLKVRILASDIILSRDRPDGLSALNILPARIADLQEGTGPGVAVALVSGQDRMVARVTRRSARALKLAQGVSCFAIIKSVSVAPGAVSTSGQAATQE